jgi:hypothetical protein
VISLFNVLLPCDLTDHAEDLSKGVLNPESGRDTRSSSTSRDPGRRSVSTAVRSPQENLNQQIWSTPSAFAEDFWSCEYIPFTRSVTLMKSRIARQWSRLRPTQSDRRYSFKSRSCTPVYPRAHDHDPLRLSNQGVPQFRSAASLQSRQPPDTGQLVA